MVAEGHFGCDDENDDDEEALRCRRRAAITFTLSLLSLVDSSSASLQVRPLSNLYNLFITCSLSEKFKVPQNHEVCSAAFRYRRESWKSQTSLKKCQ